VLLINHSTKEQSELSTETCSAPLAQLCAFDVLAMDGDDLRNLPLSMRKTNLARLSRAGRMEFSSANLNRLRSDQTCSAKPASSG